MSLELMAEPLLAPARLLRAVLFDLDGTLIDSAPDLAGAANEMRAERGQAPLAYELLRPMVGSGARGMLGVSLAVTPAHEDFESLKAEFLSRYERRMLQETAVFADVPPMLAQLRALNLPWGIVTNKAERFALPMTRALGLAEAAGAVVGGDTTPHAKPHPGSLLEAARRIGVAPEHCAYVGDDERDILAGRAAGMLTVAASWGYLGQGGRVDAWGADFIIDEPLALLKLLQQA
ncbi:phosphoglycolate phosphatase [Paucibacter sediminis]|uniref:phosphoglycolate phosphatase n=1 Tax=Paucibacter sediminis TaxID=3019553 RepID=A0AA95NDE2_9BURK|nr:phosphoglycolate phosphatase [Paucibacter sp. S2-9]WIT10757.1 phosphoglycolate phosphatase [Paucibacter sp. S2-9]